MESILTLDRLRQSVAVKELETAHGQPLSMRKTVSVPNFSQVRIWSRTNFSFIVIFNFPFPICDFHVAVALIQMMMVWMEIVYVQYSPPQIYIY